MIFMNEIHMQDVLCLIVILFFVIPIVTFLVAKAATLGIYRGKKHFQEIEEEENKNGQEKRT